MKTRAPLRISFAGGGTDIEPYCSLYGGCVISAAIQIYAEATYPSERKKMTPLEQSIIDHFHCDGISISTHCVAAPMSGLGGSAANFVAGIRAITEMTKQEIAELAFDLERNKLGVLGGKQDQYAAAFGGLNYLTFEKDGRVGGLHIPIPEGLEDLLLLVYLGKRIINGHDIIKDQSSRDNRKNFDIQKAIVQSMHSALGKDDFKLFGLLLEQAWQSKVQFSPYVTSVDINEFHDKCLQNGAIAGKLTGAGGGGYMLLMEWPNKPGELRKYLRSQKIKYLNVKFDTEGVKCL